MKKIKVLYILPSINKANGVNKFIYNYLSHLNDDKYKFEILTQESRTIDFAKNYERIGVKVHILPSFKKNNIFTNLKNIRLFFKQSDKYDIVHCNVVNYGAFYLHEAKKKGSKIRILHSHATKSSDKLISKIRNFFLEPIAKHYANEFAACSIMAGEYLFKKKQFHLIYNAMDIDYIQKNIFSNSIDANFLTISHTKKVIGFVGRLVKQKNPLFIVKIAHELSLIYKNFIILIIGTGQLEHEMINEINKNHLNQYFYFLGEVEDATPYYHYMDCFILPSIFEGLPLVAIEAQLSGLPCLISEQVTNEVKISPLCELLSIKYPDIWANKIIDCFSMEKKYTYVQKYDINYAKNDLLKYYNYLLKKHNCNTNGDKNAK